MQTLNLLISHIVANQLQPEVTANEAFDRLDTAIAGRLALSTTGGTTTLTDAQARNAILDVSGALTSNAIINVPARAKLYAVRNATSGAFTLTVKTASGTGVVVRQGYQAMLFCDGTNVGTATDAQMADHLAASDPHPQYATDADLTNHINNATDAHNASAVSNVAAGNIAAITVQDAINELDSEKAGLSLANVFTQPQTVPDGTAAGHAVNKGQVDAVQANLDTHINDATGAHAASAISNDPAGNLSSTDIQAAVNELDAEKAGISLANTFTKRQTLPDAVLNAVDLALGASTTYVDAIIYDTAKDSDGGAWRERCSHLSWYNEARPSGRFLGRYADRASAINGNPGWTVNDWYARTGSQQFMQLTATAETEIFRAGSSKFPARVLIAAEAGRVVIYDLTDPQVTMWMVFVAVSGPSKNAVNINGEGGVTSLAMSKGSLLTGSYSGGVSLINLIADSAFVYFESGMYTYNGAILARNKGLAATLTQANTKIISRYVNDVAITGLPTARIDAQTGLPVPTIAAATNGGVSIIKDDGSVVNITGQVDTVNWVEFTDTYQIATIYDYQSRTAIFDIPKASVTLSAYLRRYALSREAAFDPSIPKILGPTAVPNKGISGAVFNKHGVTKLTENPSTPASGMAAYLTHTYNSGHMPGDIRGAWLADTVAESLTAPELVTNGTFDVDTSGWTAGAGAALSLVTNTLQVDNDATGTNAGYAYQSLATVVGKTYKVLADFILGSDTQGSIKVGTAAGGDQNGTLTLTASAVGKGFNFTATAATTYINFVNSAAASVNNRWDNISIKQVDADRSVKATGLSVIGTLTKAAVASGANLMAYSGFSSANYLEQPASTLHDYGTVPFAILGWLNEPANTAAEVLFERAYYTAGAYSGARIRLEIDVNGKLLATYSDGTNTVTQTSTNVVDNALWNGFVVGYDGTNFRMFINGTEAATAVARGSVASLNNANAIVRVGLDVSGANPLNGKLALSRATAMFPSPEQIAYIAAQEKDLFQPDAKCTLDGTSSAVTALSYDDDADLLHVGTSWGRSVFKGLRRISSEATPVGAIKAIAASKGTIAQVGASGGDIYVPALALKEELERGEEQASQFGASLEPFWFDATASQTDFKLPAGWKSVAVYSAGALKRDGSTYDYIKLNDGFIRTIRFNAGLAADTVVCIMARRK